MVIFKSKNKIAIIGNGGSAAIASHFAVDLIKSGNIRSSPIKAFSLTDNSALLTATANDYKYDEVFSWQLKEIANPGDLLFAISSSGNSTNILNAIQCAKELNVHSISLTGFDGGKAAAMADIALVAKSEIGNYGPVEDVHSIVCHYISRQVRFTNV